MEAMVMPSVYLDVKKDYRCIYNSCLHEKNSNDL